MLELRLVLGSDLLLGEAGQDAPAPVVLIRLDVDHPARDQEWNDVLWLGHDLPDLVLDLHLLSFKLLFLPDIFLVFNSDRLVLCELAQQLLLQLWAFAFLLELMEAVHEDVLWVDILDPHHVQEHVVAEVEGRVEGIRLALQDCFGVLGLKLLVGH